jgi:PTH1 family peptidyl-tRNA hydrolase
VGLGNPGSQYEGTRHNIGFTVVDELASRLKARFKAGRGEFYAALARHGESELVLIKPVTYMNDSGIAVEQARELYEAAIGDLLIVYDDFNIPLGTIRIRERGTDGGHNGMASVIYNLQTDEIARVRCGIGADTMPMKRAMIEFVLSDFEPNEVERVQAMVQKASDAVLMCVTDGIAAAMNAFNSTSV